MILAEHVVIIGIALIIFNIIGFLWSIYRLIRNDWLSTKYNLLLAAIEKYQIACAEHGVEPQVDFNDLANYDKAFKQYFNWRPTVLLEESKAELIKEYITKI